MDDWKDEYLPRLEKSLIYKTLKTKCETKDPDVITIVHDAVSYAIQRSKTILLHMGEFTLHDEDHLFRVLSLMEGLITPQKIDGLTSPELMLLILTAFFHDIGMSPRVQEVITWKKVWDFEPEIEESEKQSFDEFKRFYSAQPDQQEIIEGLIAQGKNTKADTIKSYLISEYIRQSHADRAREIIGNDWNNKIKFRDTDLTVEFAQLCYGHNEDALLLLELDKNYICGQGIVVCLPLVGVVLRLADILDFDGKRTPKILFSHLYVRHPISLQEWSKHRAVDAWDINEEIIQYSAKCNHPAIEASIHNFCDLIDHELTVCNNIITNLNEFNTSKHRNVNLKFPFKVTRDKIKTQKNVKNEPLYLYRETQFNLSKKQVIELLMGTKLYGNPQVALRELIQNSIDASLLRKAQEEKWGNLYVPLITIRYFTEEGEDVLEIADNGTGMDQYIIDNYYSKVGSSFYKSTDFYNLKSESNADFTPTSRFGIGILSCFMVADTLIVDTKRVYGPHKSSDAINVSVEGQDSIFWIKPGKRETPGTTTKLILRKAKNPWDKMTEGEFIKSVESVVPNPPFEINIITNKENKTINESSFEQATASSLKDYSWEENENVQVFEIPLNYKELGILGSAIVAILIEGGEPTKSLAIHSRDIEIEGNTYALKKEINLEQNKIIQRSTSITINDDGEIKEDTSTQHLASSKSKLSLHGIEVPASLFPEYWAAKPNQVKLQWPFPLIVLVDICGTNDLDLNSPRTEIIMSDKWLKFEETLAYLVCTEISKLVSMEYWEKLKEVLSVGNSNEPFMNGFNKVVKI